MHDSDPRPMRRFDRAVTNLPDILAILDQCEVMRLGMSGPEGPYVVPLNFGYREKNGVVTIFFHCARAGRKADMLTADPRVCFEADCRHSLIAGDNPCAYSYGYESVIGFGRVRLLSDAATKAAGLSCLMARFSSAPVFEFELAILERAAVYALDVEHMAGKRH